MADSALSRRLSEFIGVTLFAWSLLWLVALASHSAADPVWFFNTGSGGPPANLAGRLGAFMAELSSQLVGYAAYLIPVVMAVIGWHYFWCRVLDAAYTKLIGAGLLFCCTSAFLSLVVVNEPEARAFRAGGYLGDFLAGSLADYLNKTGSFILILTLLFLAVILSTQFSFGRLFQAIGEMILNRWAAFRAGVRERREERRREKQRQEVLKKHLEKAGKEAKPQEALAGVSQLESRESPVPRPAVARNPREAEPDPAGPRPSRTAAMVGAAAAALRAASSKPTPAPAIRRPPQVEPSLPLGAEVDRAPAERKKGAYTLPPLALLDAPRTERKIDERELMEGARLLEEKCREFSVEGSVVQIHPGPVVTTYEFKPDAGVKYSKITGLADDLCLAMQAESVLIDRIPGKSTVGIQIPNINRDLISMRELLEADAYKRSQSKLTLALGKTIHGEPFVSDLATMPHLLIAGSTGTGKSVSVNAMLSSILFRATPDDVRMIMIDPKRLELGMYEEIPHLLTPVVVDPKLAANALRWAVREMEERYKTLAAVGVRNIEQYNRNLRNQQVEAKGPVLDDKGIEIKTLPFIVVLIDELADLMMVASNEVEESICRLAQMARAVGIHLILATQRPSVDVITGLIKANLPARISFRVSSKIDSRTILDGNGAEQLLGKGDMLYLPPASSRFVRLHGPYISEQESARLASFLRKQGKPTYDTTITDDERKTGGDLEFDKDDLYDEASRIVVSSGQASISYLQRRLRIGFSRAARLVDMMEAEGLVSAAAGGKAREVLVKADYFEEVDAQLR
ncbi:MAG: DNA translocase FtsK 4TM domain-containing protein [Acidobacteria bacterium]|nr:DNA translocase FtsK 4TM domain-containing protein [Acidobacteriota bacterium]MBA3886679.1 DNA translocase FtsK 4TM domain-containing protein [Acidobacteriota bacterium]